MNNDDFFSKKEEKVEPVNQPQESKVKVGEKEYTQEELSKLVGLGEVAHEYETKWNRPISEFYPDYTQKSQQLAELRRQEEEVKKQQLTEKANSGNQLSPEEAKQMARQQAKELGLITDDSIQDYVNQAVSNAMAGQKLINESENLVNQMTQKGLPKIELTDLLAYMDGNNPTGTKFGTPEMAYQDKYRGEIESWKSKQIQNLKPEGMVTNDQSTAGGKVPQQNSITSKEALTQAIRASLTRGHGGA